jgi:uncharacterized protein
MANPVVQWQIVAKDAEGLASFYSRLFGWKMDDRNALGYRKLHSGEFSGGVWPRGEEGQNLVQLFVQVDDIDEYLKKAETLGARTLIPRQQLPDGDAMALVIDPSGLSFALYTPATSAASVSSNRR